MLTGLRLKNFKCFADTGDIRLAPLTLIFGKNNSGKSTILQSVLLLRQSIDAGIGQRLNLGGPLYAAGSYSDLVHQHQSKRHVEMRFSVQPSGELYGRFGLEGDAVELEFAADEPHPPKLSRLFVVSGRGAIEIRRGRGAGGPYELYFDDASQGKGREAGFDFPENRFLPILYDSVFTGYVLRGPGRPRQEPQDVARRAARHVLSNFERVLHNVRSMNAFRPPPLRRYEFRGVLPGLGDPAGENTVAALIEEATRGRGRKELIGSLNQWLKQVGHVKLLPIRRLSQKARIFELRVRDTDSGRWANFADVGSGIGQAFPVLVEGLRTPEEGTFLVQEPEIHLHPDAQLAMADFLVNLVLSGRQVIAETHSENLLLRIRRAVLQLSRRRSGTKLVPELVQVLYVDKTRAGESEVHPVKVDELGQLVGWPKGFMEEATRERLKILETRATAPN